MASVPIQTSNETLSKLLVSPLITPIVVPYIIPINPPLRSSDYSSNGAILCKLPDAHSKHRTTGGGMAPVGKSFLRQCKLQAPENSDTQHQGIHGTSGGGARRTLKEAVTLGPRPSIHPIYLILIRNIFVLDDCKVEALGKPSIHTYLHPNYLTH